MPNLASSKKDLRRTEKRTAFNDRLRSRVKKAVKNFNTLLSENNTEKAVAALQQATKVLGKAAQKKVFKKKTSARTISRLTKKLNKTTANNVKTAQQGS